ncbi:MAG: diaminopimelate epimerase [Phycisphaerales bacterium]|nr:diaminopimelate epimerase [Phycisphaerales bacterium]
MRFTKAHGLGNDYVFLDAVAEPALWERPDLPQLAQRISDRNSGAGVGSDGIIVFRRATADTRVPGAHFSVRILNADGSDGGMCGNGSRCVGMLAVRRGYCAPPAPGAPIILDVWGHRVDVLRVDAPPGRADAWVTLDMGAPVLDLRHIPVDPSHVTPLTSRFHEYAVDGRICVFVNVGNPHAVVFADRIDTIRLGEDGPRLEKHPAFPQRINAQFAQVLDRRDVRVRTWERGAGPTRACGSGACAVIVAGVLTNRLERRATVRMPGGALEMEWREADNRIILTGPAEEVFSGDWPAPSPA